jgi:hypothetical protein
LSPGQASYVLDRLVADRRLSAGEISRYVSDMHREISDLESRLNSLRSAAGVGAAAPVRRRPGRPPKAASAAGAPAPVQRRGRKRRGRPPAAASAAAAAPAAVAAPVGRRRGRKRRSAITPEQLASRQLQGRYLGLIRQIPASKRGQYQKIAKDQGREAAIREMATTLRK